MRGELRTWLDKLHNFVAKLANLWTEGSDEDRQTAARFLRDMVGSDYGKAAIGLAAGAALPHAAPLANKLLREAGELVASEQALDVAGRGAAALGQRRDRPGREHTGRVLRTREGHGRDAV